VLLERGLSPPAWFDDAPDILPGHEFFLKAFWELSTERQIGFAIGPIPVSRVRTYAAQNGLDEQSTELLVHVVRSMDGAYLKWVADERRKKAEK